MRIAKTVAGIYVLDGDTVVDSADFRPDDLPAALLDDHPLETEYSDAEPTVLSLEEIEELSGVVEADLRERQVEAARSFTKGRVSAAGGRDKLLVQAVRALDDINERNNELSERVRPWFALHFPELDDMVDDHEAFAGLVAEHADRDGMDDFAEAAEDSTGMPLTGEDQAMLERFAAHLEEGYALRTELEEYVDALAGEVVPNVAAVLGGLLAARIVSLAGSLEQLAKMPSSTIQVLGAEKAMFRHMEGEGSAPKHGVLFHHEHVQNVAPDDRGTMARVLANKTAIAARLDQYGDDFRGEELRTEVDERFQEL